MTAPSQEREQWPELEPCAVCGTPPRGAFVGTHIEYWIVCCNVCDKKHGQVVFDFDGPVFAAERWNAMQAQP